MEDVKPMRDVFAKCVEIMDEVIALQARADAGESVDEDIESASGRLLVQLLKIQSL